MMVFEGCFLRIEKREYVGGGGRCETMRGGESLWWRESVWVVERECVGPCGGVGEEEEISEGYFSILAQWSK